eukprot:gene17199-18929_t
MVAHSLLQGGPHFQHFTPWVVDILTNENGTSGDILLEDIPVTCATGCLINFIKSLKQCETKEAINELFDTFDAPAFEQIISSSDWDPQEDVTVGNKNILIDMLLHEQTINRRGRKVVAMHEGLLFMQFGKCLDLAVSKLLFLGIKDIIDNGYFLSVLEFDDADSDKKLAVRASFETLVQKASQELLVNILKFAPGFEDFASFEGKTITVQCLHFSNNIILLNASI